MMMNERASFVISCLSFFMAKGRERYITAMEGLIAHLSFHCFTRTKQWAGKWAGEGLYGWAMIEVVQVAALLGPLRE